MKLNNLRSKLADDLEIPNNVLSNNFDMRVQGDKKLILENHLGITIYEDDVIGIKTKEHTVTVKGSGFRIEEINEYKIIIDGVIEEIKISGRRKGEPGRA